MTQINGYCDFGVFLFRNIGRHDARGAFLNCEGGVSIYQISDAAAATARAELSKQMERILKLFSRFIQKD